jgi:hypothetical protein
MQLIVKNLEFSSYTDAEIRQKCQKITSKYDFKVRNVGCC